MAGLFLEFPPLVGTVGSCVMHLYRNKAMNMIEKFNELMEGFIEESITMEYLLNNPEGILVNGSSSCRYKLKEFGSSKVLGAYGVSRFANWRFYEISESGEILYEWYLQEGYNPNDTRSLEDMNRKNQLGHDRIEAFGIK